MQKIHSWVWTSLAGMVLGASGVGALVLKIYPTPFNSIFNPSPPNTVPSSPVSPSISPSTTQSDPETPSPNHPPVDLESIKISVRDKKSKLPIEDAEVRVAAKEGIPTKRTLNDGTVVFQIPKQPLGEVKVLIVKSGYKTIEVPDVFRIDPNEIPTYELEEDTSNPTSGTSSSPPKIDWGILKTYFDIDDDVNIQPGSYDTITVHVTAKKDFNAISFRAQPYDAYGVRTAISGVTFSYLPQKWRKDDRSQIRIDTPHDISKLEIIY